MKKKSGRKTTFDKVNEVAPQFADSVYTLTNEQLKEEIINLSKQDEQIEEARKNDQDLQSIKEQLKTANQTYSEPLRINKLKRKLILEILSERGKL